MRVAVTGPCASGKSTVVEQLKRYGFDAYVVSQEHSIIRDLWRRQSPDALVYLDVQFATVQARRGENWPRWIYDVQLERLEDARNHATVVVGTDAAPVDETIRRIVDRLNAAGYLPGASAQS